MNGRREFTITKLRLDDDGVWRARVTVDGVGVDVDRLYGSWRVPGDPARGTLDRQVHTYIALELAAKVRAIENARGPRVKKEGPSAPVVDETPTTDQPRALIG